MSPVEKFSNDLWLHVSEQHTARYLLRLHVDDQAAGLMIVSRRKGWPAARAVAEVLAAIR